MSLDLDTEDRVVILLALDTLIEEYEEMRRESLDYSAFHDKQLRAARRARDKLRAADKP